MGNTIHVMGKCAAGEDGRAMRDRAGELLEEGLIGLCSYQLGYCRGPDEPILFGFILHVIESDLSETQIRAVMERAMEACGFSLVDGRWVS